MNGYIIVNKTDGTTAKLVFYKKETKKLAFKIANSYLKTEQAETYTVFKY